MGRKEDAGRERPDEVIRVDGKIRQRENRYYLKVAERYRAAGFIILLLLALFGGVMLMRYSEYITYDNFVYLLRDFDSSANGEQSSYSDIIYTAEDRMTFCAYRGSLSAVGNRSVRIYDLSGAVICEGDESFSNPGVSASSKYLLAYDIGGNSYSIYNSAARVVSRQTDGALISASVSNSGAYAVTSESDSSRYVTEVYSSALRRIMSIYTDKYVTDSAISLDGEHLAIAAMFESGAGISCEVSFYEAGTEQASGSITYSGAMPVSLCAMEGGAFFLLTDDAARFIEADGTVKCEYQLEGSGISYLDACASGAIVVVRSNDMGSQSRVYSFDNTGNILYNSLIDFRVTGTAVSTDGRYAGYLMSSGTVSALTADGGHIDVDVDGEILRAVDVGYGLVICGPASAHIAVFPNDGNS